MKRAWLVAAVVLSGALGVAQSAPSGQVNSGAAATAAQAPAARPALTTEQQLAAAQKRLLDWAQLGYYRERNAALAAPAAGEQRVVFFGDSITEVWQSGSWEGVAR